MITLFERAPPKLRPPAIAIARITVTGALLESGIAEGVFTCPITKTLHTLGTITVSPAIRGIFVSSVFFGSVPRITVIGLGSPGRRTVMVWLARGGDPPHAEITSSSRNCPNAGLG